MGLQETLNRLRSCHLAGLLTDLEYDRLRWAYFQGEDIDERLDELEKNDRPKFEP